MALSRIQVTVMLGIAQTLSWASSSYLLAVLATPISQSVGTSYSQVFGAFSVALLVAAAVGPISGRLIDRFGGRFVLISSNIVFAVGLFALSQASQPVHLFAAWALMGVAMGSGLYESAFATVVHLYGQNARPSITGITLFAGFASVVGWPFSSYIEGLYDWRVVCMSWAALHLLVGLPLNALLSFAKPEKAVIDPSMRPAVSVSEDRGNAGNLQRTAYLMAYVFAAALFITTAMMAHLPQIIQASGAALPAAIAAAALVGPAQVAGRVLEYRFQKAANPLFSARLAILAHPLAAICLLVVGAPAAGIFAILHGLGMGIVTIAIGTLPLKVFGAQGYGRRQGWLMIPARLMQASSPFVFGLAVTNWGVQALFLSSVLAISAFAALWMMRLTSSPS